MKIFILSCPNSIHTKRWVTSLSEKGIEILLCGFTTNRNDTLNYYHSVQNLRVLFFEVESLNTINYLSKLLEIKRKIAEYKPDILHAHYASSYGLLGALSGFHPYVLSVWGSDVYDFPNINGLTKWVLKFNLRKADKILSTSLVMANETKKYTSKDIQVTPFGVDTSLFKKTEEANSIDGFVVGNVKTLAPKYGIDILIKAFKLIVDKNPLLQSKLVIVGDGPNKQEYIDLVSKLELKERVEFKGKVPNNQLPTFYNSFSVAVSPSVLNSESFGVVAVEAMSCECPVITSDADGFTEVVEHGETGLIVPKQDINATAEAIQKFVDNPNLRQIMGKKGRERVLKLYDWNDNVELMCEIYDNVLKGVF